MRCSGWVIPAGTPQQLLSLDLESERLMIMNVSKGFRENLTIWVLLMNITAVQCANSGSIECPCIHENDARFSAALAQLSNKGYPDGYGARGCRQYDLNHKLTGCEVPTSEFYCDRYLLAIVLIVTVMSMDLLATR